MQRARTCRTMDAPRKAAFAALLVVAQIAALPATPARADVTIASCGSNLVNVTNLIAAFEAANDESTNPGPDTINLPPGCTYTLTETYFDNGPSGWFGLPQITSPITLNARGSIIERQDPSDGQPGGGPMGFFDVTSDAGLVIQDLILRNGGGFNGGFIHNRGFVLIVDSALSDSAFGNNDSALVNEPSGHLTLLDTTMHNHDLLGTGGSGGAINNSGDLFLINATLTNNTVQAPLGNVQVGGAITNKGTTTIWDSTFSTNRAAVGGAIHNIAGELFVTDSTFVDNSANFGAAINNQEDLDVTGSYFESNDAGVSGGAINNEGLGSVLNSTFKSNTAGRGGAISNTSVLRVEHSTFGDNVAVGGTGGILNNDDETGTLVLEANVLKGSRAQCEGTIVDFGDNLVWPTAAGCPAGFSLGDPKLGSPALNGGSTLNLALGDGSAAIDLAGACTKPDVDQRGKSRPAGPGCDSGAFEDQLPSVPTTPTLSAGSALNNSGHFTLDWGDSTDPDGETPTYRLHRKDADDEGFSLVASPTHSMYSFGGSTPEGEGTFRYRVQSFDGNHFSSNSSQSGAIVVDKTAPTAPTALADRGPDYVPASGNGWYRTPVTITLSGSTDPQLPDGSSGSGVAVYTAPQTFSTSGLHTAAGTATDNAGNVSAVTSLEVQVDADPPSVQFASCPPTVILGSDASLDWTASDAHSGLASAPSGSILIDTSSIGARSYTTPVATDNVGQTSSLTCELSVVYDFTGFFDPVMNPPDTNEVSAGQVIPVIFSLSGDQGPDIFAADYPVSAEIPCESGDELEEGEPTSTSRRGLTFSPGGDGRYTYRWKTSLDWKETCRQFVVLLDDGTFHRANFEFK